MGMERQRLWLWDGEHDLGRRYDPDDAVLRASRRQSWKRLVRGDGETLLPLPDRRRNWPSDRSQAGTEIGSWGAVGRAAVGLAWKSLLPSQGGISGQHGFPANCCSWSLKGREAPPVVLRPRVLGVLCCVD